MMQLTPQSLKPAVTEALNSLLEPIQHAFISSSEWQVCERLAYPPPPGEEKKKQKKPKDKRTKAPSRNVQAQPDGSVAGPEGDTQQTNLGDNATQAMKELDLEKKTLQKGDASKS